MKVITWNVNSIRSRLERLLAVLERHDPDVVCLQELKTVEENFPYEPLRDAGYRAAVLGQKTYNGVAILSKSEPEDVQRGVDDNPEDPQARLISAVVGDVRIFSAYFPNGGTVGSDKWEYKLKWIRRLTAKLAADYSPDDRILICGDSNVAIRETDVANPDKWTDSVLFHPDARDALRDLTDWGLVDVFAKLNPDGGVYSWWDYRQLSFPKNDGLRIDHVFATKILARNAETAVVDRDERKGKSPSDHAPVIVDFRT